LNSNDMLQEASIHPRTGAVNETEVGDVGEQAVANPCRKPAERTIAGFGIEADQDIAAAGRAIFVRTIVERRRGHERSRRLAGRFQTPPTATAIATGCAHTRCRVGRRADTSRRSSRRSRARPAQSQAHARDEQQPPFQATDEVVIAIRGQIPDELRRLGQPIVQAVAVAEGTATPPATERSGSECPP
jgi:hypothetical protein